MEEEHNEIQNKEIDIISKTTSSDVAFPRIDSSLSFESAFGRGALGSSKSFGGHSLAKNAERLDEALLETAELHKIWNHAHTQWMWKHLNLSYHSVWKNIRQISAEITNKKAALDEAKWKHVENEIRIRETEEEIEALLQKNDPNDKWVIVKKQAKVAKLKEGMVVGMSYIEGAMKDILALTDVYKTLKEKYGTISEDDVEREETIAHLKRSIVQSIRDVRMQGVISKGEQEYLEQIGVNPGKLNVVLREYVEEEAKSKFWDATGLHEFVDTLCDELAPVAKIKMDLMGYPDINTENLYQANDTTERD